MLKVGTDSTKGSGANHRVMLPLELSTTTPFKVNCMEDFFDNLGDEEFFEFEDVMLMKECHHEYLRLAFELPPLVVYEDGTELAALPPVYVTHKNAGRYIKTIVDVGQIVHTVCKEVEAVFGHLNIIDVVTTLRRNRVLLFPFFAFGLVEVNGSEYNVSQPFFNYSPIGRAEVNDVKKIKGRISNFMLAHSKVKSLLTKEANDVIDDAHVSSLLFFS